MHVVWVGVMQPSLTILSQASKENFSHSSFLSGFMRSSLVFGCTFKVYISQLQFKSLRRNLRSSDSFTRPISSSNSRRAASMLGSPSVFPPGDCHMLFITSSYCRNIRIPSLLCTITITNLAWTALYFISFLRALIGILFAVLLSPGSLDIASVQAMVRPPLCLMVNSYC